MDKDKKDIIDDLFEYYDDKSIEETTVVNVTPKDEVLGDTLIVNTNNVSSNTDDTPYDATTQINIHKERVAPTEELLGNLDISGKPLEEVPVAYRRRVTIDTPKNTAEPEMVRKNVLEAPASRPTGIWFRLKPLWVTMIVCVVLLGAFKFYITDTGLIGTYKRNFSYNFSLILRMFGADSIETELPAVSTLSKIAANSGLFITAYAEETEKSYKTIPEAYSSVPLPGANKAKFEKYKGGVICAKSNYVGMIDKNGKKKWEYTTSISDPILKVAGNYIVVAANNSTQLMLYKGKELIYSTDTNNTIKTCNVSPKGDVAVVTDKTAYKGAVSVYNNKGEEVFHWVSGVNHITSAAILKNRRVSVSLVSTKDTLKSYVMVFDIYTPDPLSGAELTDTLIYSTSPYKNSTYACGDNSISSINSDGQLNYNIKFDNMIITHTSSDEYGWRLASYTDNNLPYINIYNNRGKLRYSIPIEISPDFAALYKSTVLYNDGRDIICGKATSSEKSKYTAPMTITRIVMMDKDMYMVAYENSIEFIKI